MEDIFEGLNSRQKEAVTSTEGRIRVVAGAGTGKTKALTHRYAYIVNVLGIDPANILCLTFTNKAAAEMRSRIAGMVHSGDYNDFVCTIHGFCVKFLRKEIYRLGFPKSFTVLDEEDCKAIAKEAMDEMGLKRTEKTVKMFLEEIGASKALQGYIGTYMLPGVKVSDNQRKTSKMAAYVSRQMKNYALDFDDLLNLTRYILDRFPEALAWWQEALNYIMVDEAQDCNTDDWDLIERLAGGHRNLFIVGDPDQAIYEWRGARPDLFVNFGSDKDIILDENYRSTPKILDVANCVISNNHNRIPKDLFTRKEEGKPVIHFHGKSETEETEWIISQIRTLRERGVKLNDIAILYRSTYLSRALEQALLNAKIDYTIWGGTRFFERREIKDALSYLRLINNQDDDISFRRIINVPSRKIGRKFMDSLEAAAERDGISLYSALQIHISEFDKPGARAFIDVIEDGKQFALGGSISDLLNRVLEGSGLKKAIREDQDEERLENLDELLSSIKFYERSRSEEEVTLSDYLQDIALYTNDDHRKEAPTLKMMTIHQAKGLEFKLVWIYGLNEGVLPSHRTIRERGEAGLEEERRLMYVACTRAMDRLFFSDSEGFNVQNSQAKYPSRFIREAEDCCGPLYDIEGSFSPTLWDGTDKLILSLESPRPSDESGFEIGAKVHHPVFGNGVVTGEDTDSGIVSVRFEGFGVRRIAPNLLEIAPASEENC